MKSKVGKRTAADSRRLSNKRLQWLAAYQILWWYTV